MNSLSFLFGSSSASLSHDNLLKQIEAYEDPDKLQQIIKIARRQLRKFQRAVPCVALVSGKEDVTEDDLKGLKIKIDNMFAKELQDKSFKTVVVKKFETLAGEVNLDRTLVLKITDCTWGRFDPIRTDTEILELLQQGAKNVINITLSKDDRWLDNGMSSITFSGLNLSLQPGDKMKQCRALLLPRIAVYQNPADRIEPMIWRPFEKHGEKAVEEFKTPMSEAIERWLDF